MRYRYFARVGLALVLAAGLALLATPRTATAHPMGNFSINQYSALTVGGGRVALRYIVDMRAVTVMAYSCSRVRHVAMTQIFRGGQRRAIVAATDEQYGIARMFATFAALEGEVAEVFREWRPAVEWLGLTGALAADPGVGVAAR